MRRDVTHVRGDEESGSADRLHDGAARTATLLYVSTRRGIRVVERRD
jgi:hypothetical protein